MKSIEPAARRDDAKIILTEEEQTEQGARIAAALGLRQSSDYPDRWYMGDYGTKSAIGVYRVVFHLAHPGAV